MSGQLSYYRPEMHVDDVMPRLEPFKVWLNQCGAEVMASVSKDELLRFRSNNIISSMVRRKGGHVSCWGESKNVWEHYLGKTYWRGTPKTEREVGHFAHTDLATIRKRDGHNCFFCCLVVDYKDESLEHLVAITHGGPQHISNKFLTHSDCNKKAGCLSALEKIKIHTDSMLAVAITIYKERNKCN